MKHVNDYPGITNRIEDLIAYLKTCIVSMMEQNNIISFSDYPNSANNKNFEVVDVSGGYFRIIINLTFNHSTDIIIIETNSDKIVFPDEFKEKIDELIDDIEGQILICKIQDQI